MAKKRTALISIKTFPEVKRDLIQIAETEDKTLSEIGHELLDEYRKRAGAR